MGRTIAGNRWLLVLLTPPLVALSLIVFGAGFAEHVLGAVVFFGTLLTLVYLLLRFAIGPLPRFIARRRVSVRWKVLTAICVMAFSLFFVTVSNCVAMDHMHSGLHDIQELGRSQPAEVRPAVDELEKTQHGLLFSLTPVLALLASMLAAGLGLAVGLSVVNPVRRMGQAMRRMAAGDFSQPLRVENRDELGDLAEGINQAAQDLARLQEATLAEERARALRERIAQVTLAQEEERRRISRELHDSLGPSLAGIGNRLRACRYTVRTDPERTESELDEIAGALKGHVQEIRELIYDLRPLALDHLGLVGAVKQHAERFARDTGIPTAVSSSGEPALNPLAEATAFRVVQECLSNIQKHAGATRVDVHLEGRDGALVVTVADNGRGFDADEPGVDVRGKGLGLLSMRERAELAGGELAVQSIPGGGCRVVLHIPALEVANGACSRPAGG